MLVLRVSARSSYIVAIKLQKNIQEHTKLLQRVKNVKLIDVFQKRMKIYARKVTSEPSLAKYIILFQLIRRINQTSYTFVTVVRYDVSSIDICLLTTNNIKNTRQNTQNTAECNNVYAVNNIGPKPSLLLQNTKISSKLA